MDMSSLYSVLPFLNELDKERRQQFEEYFRSAPAWLMDSFRIVNMDKDVIFVKENAPADAVFFIGKGVIKAVDYRIYGIAFDFMRFEGLYAMGGMEVVMDLDTYKTTLQTVTPCTFVKIPREKFAEWLSTDIRALKQEAKMIGEYLLEQGRSSRAYLFLQGADRLALVFMDMYKKYSKNGLLLVDSTRQALSDASGLCVKTVNRAVKKFENDGWISRQGSKITINAEQYETINAFLSKIIEQ
ncbi:MAG: Crp/Fnr family transcriptional regulator [Clostridium sp.]|nr:Crp/Fnr family transcriptional regulator [Clostridium sp.]